MSSNLTDSTVSNEAVKDTTALSSYEKNKLRIAGLLNGVGDITLLVDGYKKGKKFTKLAGWLYTAGAAVITVFGSVDKDSQVKDLSERTAEFLENKSDNISANSEAADVIRQKNNGMFAKASRYLKRHSGQVMLWFYTLGAGALLAGGIKDYRSAKEGEKKPIGDLMVGGFSLLVKGVSFLLPEKSADTSQEISDEKKNGIIGWIKEKPMRLFGYGSMITEGFWGYRAYEAKKSGGDWKLSAATGAAYMASDLVIATANKDAKNAAGKMQEQQQSKIEDMVAETIAGQSKDKQESLAQQTAEFLEKESSINGNADDLRESILNRVEQIKDKSWVGRAGDDKGSNTLPAI